MGVTLMLENGGNPRVIQQLAGWTSLRMLERYGHARDAEAVVSAVADYLQTIEVPKEADNELEKVGPKRPPGLFFPDRDFPVSH
jgi:integrase